MVFKQNPALAIATLATLVLFSGCSVMTAEPAASKASADAGVFFEDFNYADTTALTQNGWIIRNKAGLPGVAGGQWGAGSVTLADDPQQAGNRILRMAAWTDGTAQGTVQSQLCHARKYFEGTYATRIRLANAPATGPNGDTLIQSFYLVGVLKHDYDPEYSELDWEYLANGGWGDSKTRLYSTSWQTVQLNPWNAYNQHHEEFRALDGWHILLMQVSGGKTHYFVDGVQVDVHGGRNYPVTPMSLNFNIWFAEGGFLPITHVPRKYYEDIDWVFHARNKVLSPADVDAAVKDFRSVGPRQVDSVPAGNPLLPSTCDF